MPRITEHFGITGSVPFLDVEVTTDNRLFIDPRAIRLRTEPEPFVTQANACTTSFFNSVAVWCHSAGRVTRPDQRPSTAAAVRRAAGDTAGACRSWLRWPRRRGGDRVVDLAGIHPRSAGLGGRGSPRSYRGHPLVCQGVDRDITSDLTTRIIFGPHRRPGTADSDSSSPR